MTSQEHVVDLIDQHIGIGRSRAESVARRLKEADLLPSGSPGKAPEFSRTDALTLLVAVNRRQAR